MTMKIIRSDYQTKKKKLTQKCYNKLEYSKKKQKMLDFQKSLAL